MSVLQVVLLIVAAVSGLGVLFVALRILRYETNKQLGLWKRRQAFRPANPRRYFTPDDRDR
jgi:hypothetical protein